MNMEAVIFDLDGTLLDTTDGIVESAQYAARKMNFRHIPYEEWLSFIGPPIYNSFISHFKCSSKEAQKATDIFRDYYMNNALYKAVPYEDIFTLCKLLYELGIRMAVATYKREDYAIKLLHYFGFDMFCNPIHGADDKNILKKHDIVNLCINNLNVDKHRCVLVGDTEHDYIGAKEADIAFIGVTYGFGFKNVSDVQSLKTIGVAKKPLEIAKIVMNQ